VRIWKAPSELTVRITGDPHNISKKKPDNTVTRLYDVKADLGENNNLADKHPEIVERLVVLAEKAIEELGDEDRDEDRPGKGQRPAGWVDNPKPMLLPKYDK